MRKCKRKDFERITADNFPKFMKNINVNFQEVHKS